MKLSTIKVVLLSLGMSFGTAYAANQGTLGATSTGDLNINATVPDLILISALSDINLGTFTGTADLTGAATPCVYRNGAGTYQITISGDGAASAFTLTDGSNTVPYSVTYNDGGGATAVATTVVLTTQNNADTTSTTCGGGSNATVDVTVATADLAAMPASAYAGTMTLVVAPE